MGNPVYFVFWLLIFLLFSFFVAYFCSFFYVWTYLFSQCIDPCGNISDFLLKCVQFPGYCFTAMIECKKPC
ncbi:uncharacterized protein Dvir_GJ27055 [Drosophila virilis]|uniref:Uncharacterized protein n=1 Tax=Drosophila virilis TaxID=7244 RepID=A0A0Q9WC18_DROVI|nr:uncharacterized protein Dvir_GJ27055 [Drosophila virilis]